MKLHLISLVIFLWLIQELLADEFIHPSNLKKDLETQYTIGDRVGVYWDTSVTKIDLVLRPWNNDDVILGNIMLNQKNPGQWRWMIGIDDLIDEDVVRKNPNWVLSIRDSDNPHRTGNGYSNGRLDSRAFVIKSRSTSSVEILSSSSALNSTITSSSFSSTFFTSTASSNASTSSTSSASSSVPIPSLPPLPLFLDVKAMVGIAFGVLGGTLVFSIVVGLCKAWLKSDDKRNAGTTNDTPSTPVGESGVDESETKGEIVPVHFYGSTSPELDSNELDATQSKDNYKTAQYCNSYELQARSAELDGVRSKNSNEVTQYYSTQQASAELNGVQSYDNYTPMQNYRSYRPAELYGTQWQGSNGVAAHAHAHELETTGDGARQFARFS